MCCLSYEGDVLPCPLGQHIVRPEGIFGLFLPVLGSISRQEGHITFSVAFPRIYTSHCRWILDEHFGTMQIYALLSDCIFNLQLPYSSSRSHTSASNLKAGDCSQIHGSLTITRVGPSGSKIFTTGQLPPASFGETTAEMDCPLKFTFSKSSLLGGKIFLLVFGGFRLYKNFLSGLRNGRLFNFA